MVSVLTSSAVDREFEPQSGQTNGYEIYICCLSANDATLGVRANNDWIRIRIMCSSGAACLSAQLVL